MMVIHAAGVRGGFLISRAAGAQTVPGTAGLPGLGEPFELVAQISEVPDSRLN